MNEFLNPLITQRNTAHLTKAEKLQMLSYIYEQNPAAQPSMHIHKSPFAIWGRKFVSVSLLVLLTGGIGITAAADNSLPTSTLYPIKLHVTEPIQGAVKFTPESKVSWEISKTERRFTEATELAKQGELSPEIETQLSEKIQEHAAAASAIAEETISDTQTQLELATELKSVIQLEAQKLETIIDSVPQPIEPVEPVESVDTVNESTDQQDRATEQVNESAPQTAQLSLLDTAQELSDDISDQQTSHLVKIAETDPAQARELEQAMYTTEHDLMAQSIEQTIVSTKVSLSTLELVTSLLPQPVTVKEPLPTELPIQTDTTTNTDTTSQDNIVAPTTESKDATTSSESAQEPKAPKQSNDTQSTHSQTSSVPMPTAELLNTFANVTTLPEMSADLNSVDLPIPSTDKDIAVTVPTNLAPITPAVPEITIYDYAKTRHNGFVTRLDNLLLEYQSTKSETPSRESIERLTTLSKKSLELAQEIDQFIIEIQTKSKEEELAKDSKPTISEAEQTALDTGVIISDSAEGKITTENTNNSLLEQK
jgi:hypothetical protein